MLKQVQELGRLNNMKKILSLIIIILLCSNVYAAPPTRTYTYVSNTIIDPTQNNANENALYAYLQAGVDTYAAGSISGAAISGSASIPYVSLSLSNSIVNADISSTAAIAGSKLGTLNTISPSAGLIPPANIFNAGMIMMWSGTIATIPSGWLLCDGSNSTPDLRDKFIVGANQDSGGVAKTNYTGSLTQSGGSVHHTHTYSGTTSTPSGSPIITSGSTQGVATPNHTHTYSGTTDNENVVPVVYYALAFIIKS